MGFEQFKPDQMVIGDVKSLATESEAAVAARLRDEADKDRLNLLESAVHETVGALGFGESETRKTFESTAAEFVKAVPLFIGGRTGLALSTAAFGLAEVKVGHSTSEQALELGAGMAKGFLTKSVFEHFGKKTDWNFAQKGMAMGSSSRLVENALSPQNYMVNGQFDFGRGVSRAIGNAGDMKALGVDIATFGAAHFVPGALPEKLAKSALATTTLTGSTFGFTSGVLGELQNQWHDGKPTDYSKLLLAGGKEGLLMAAAAATGFKLTPRARVAPSSDQGHRIETPKTVEALKISEPVTEAAKLQPVEKVVPLEKVAPVEKVAPAEKVVLAERVAPVEKAEIPEKAVETGPKVKEPGGYVGYFLDGASKAKTQGDFAIGGEKIPVRWTPPESLHITEKFGVRQSAGNDWAAAAAKTPAEIKVLGIAVDATGVEALRVSVDGKLLREDGKPYHVTRSLAEGRKANESMATVEKALKGEDPSRYSYRELAPNEQFTLTFEPRFKESDIAQPIVKEVKPPKPEVPFEQLAPKLQVISALKATPADYLTRTIETRTVDQRVGSYFEMTPDQLRQELFKAKWEPYDPRDSDGNPIIGGGARGYRATIKGGRLGMTSVDAIPAEAQLYLVDPKGTGKWSLSTTGAVEPKTDHVTMIVGPGADGKPALWTFHPGEPVRPSALDTAKLAETLSKTGIETSNLPENGNARRVAITREQLDQINASLPPESRMSLAKIEDAANVPVMEKPAAPIEKVVEKPVPGLEALESLPNQADRVQFQQAIAALPEGTRARFINKLNETAKNPEDVSRTTQIRGIIFEMSRLARITSQGLETIAPAWTATAPIEYNGYAKKTTDFSEPPSHPSKSTIASDVPIVRGDGLPYLYDVNSSPRRLYGNDVQQRNQILKFQQAIDQGTISGATVELSGRVSPEFVQWLTGKVVGDPVAAPNVEVLYNMPLPSGGDYTFILKRANNNNGLNFTNADRAFTPEDRRVINGIYKAIQDRSIGDIISGTNIQSPPAELAPFLADPFKIKDLNVFNQYDQLRRESTWNKLTEKADSDKVNAANPRNVTSEYNTKEYIDEATRWYQDHLKQNPQTAKAKASYLIKDEAGIQKVVDLAAKRAEEIKQYELARQASPEEAVAAAERERMGYTGRKEGVSLDMEHIIMDATQEHNKGGNRRGRTYDQPERFMSVEKVTEYLNGQDRSITDLHVFDPVTGKTDTQTNASEKQIGRRTFTLQAENVERAKQKINEYEQRYSELRTKENRTTEENNELRFLTSRHAGVNVHKSAIAKAEATIQEITAARKSQDTPAIGSMTAAERAAHIEQMKERSANYDKQIEAARTDLEGRYKQILGGEGEWNKIAQRMSVEQSNIIKFMYAVDANGKIPLTEEIVRGESSGRAAHSELAAGRNVYGAGELVFAKDPGTGKWSLVEINNASGHYRPPGAETLVYVKNLITQYGVDTSKAIINDALQRGTPLVDAHFVN